MTVIRNIKTINILVTHKCNLKCQHCYDVKNGTEMSSEVLDLTNDYLCNYIKENSGKEFHIQYIGGEVGFYNQQRIIDSINYIKEHCPNEHLQFMSQSNLVYELTDDHKKLFEVLDCVGSSYDYELRITQPKQKVLFFNNLKYIQSIGKSVNVVFTLTNPFIKHLTPQLFWDFIIASDIHNVGLNGFVATTEVAKLLLPKAEDVREWCYQTFLLYEQLKKYYDINVEEFERNIDSFYGKQEYIHSRTCILDNLTIHPNGDVATCIFKYDKPIYNLVTKEQKMDINEVFKEEQEYNDLCKSCKYLKYCNGNCHIFPFDETGCLTPYKIYDYLQEKEDLKNQLLNGTIQ